MHSNFFEEFTKFIFGNRLLEFYSLKYSQILVNESDSMLCHDSSSKRCLWKLTIVSFYEVYCASVSMLLNNSRC